MLCKAYTSSVHVTLAGLARPSQAGGVV